MAEKEPRFQPADFEPKGITESPAGRYPKRVNFPDGSSKIVYNAKQEAEAAAEAREYKLD